MFFSVTPGSLGFQSLSEVAGVNVFLTKGCPFSGLWLCPDGLCPLGAQDEFSLLALSHSPPPLRIQLSTPLAPVERKPLPFPGDTP